MSDTLTAAVVSGLLSGAVVLTGVVLAEALRRRSDRDQRQRRLVFDLVRELGVHERALGTPPVGDGVADQHAIVMSSLFELRNTTRSDAVRSAADESIARTQAAMQRYLAGTPLPVTASLGGSEIVAAALPEPPELNRRITAYVRDGLPESRPNASRDGTAAPE
jgi:hypothetical protein